MREQRISVVVPTLNRRDSLHRLLSSLRQTRGIDKIALEVIVVDNGSTDGTADYLKEASAEWPVLRGIFEGRPGKSLALNKGIGQAGGEILCLMDDDIVLDPGWLEGLVEDYATTRYDALQPRVLPGTDPEGKSADLSRLHEYNIPIVDYGEEVRAVRGLTGTNIALRRKIVEVVGRFDPRLGPGASGFSEDTEYSIRIRRAGFPIGYAPRAVVYHELDPRRYGRAYNREIQFRKGVSRGVYRRDSLLFRVLPNLLASCVRLAIYRALGKSEKVYRTEGRVMRNWGFLVGKLKFSERASSKEQR